METKRSRGRPATVDADAVASIALTLFLERGFDDVTMADIASASGIGRRTLFRYFPSKFALVWGGAAELSESILRALSEATPTEGRTGAAVAQAYREAYQTIPPAALGLIRSRLRIIHRFPEVYAYGHARWLEDHGELASFIAQHEGRESSELDVAMRAQLVSSLTFAALLWWAERDDAEFFDTMERAFVRLESCLDAPIS
ncbi:MAG: TetR family transcriptional regulator [Agromyces sp.]